MARAKLSELVGKADTDDEPTTAPSPNPSPAAAEAPASQPRRRSTSAPRRAGTKGPSKISIYQDREDTDRVRGAILHTMASEGSRTLSQFIHNATMAEVERLERKYNNGKPFPPAGVGELPQGRPMGS